MRAWIVIAAALWLVPAVAAPQDEEQVLALVAQARQRGCAGHPGTAEPLRLSAAASRAAARVAAGEAALASLEKEGMRATRVFNASFSGYRTPADVANALAQHHCSAVTQAQLTEFGIHRNGTRWLVLLAAPLQVPQLADPRAALAKVLALTNAARAQPRRCGDAQFDAVPAVRWNPRLEDAAAKHAQDMAAHVYLEHQGRDGSTPAQRITRAGYRWRSVGENVASGQLTPEDVVDDWLRSPGHCANLMSAGFTEMGVGFAVNMAAAGVVFWAQEFGTPR